MQLDTTALSNSVMFDLRSLRNKGITEVDGRLSIPTMSAVCKTHPPSLIPGGLCESEIAVGMG